MTRSVLDSAGAALAHRSYLAARLERDTDAMLAAFLSEVVVLAVADGFALSPATVHRTWDRLVNDTLASAGYLDEHAAFLAPALLDDAIPDAAYLTAREVLTRSEPTNLAADLAAALAPATALTAAVFPAMPRSDPTAPRDRQPPSWGSRLRRTVATGLTRAVGEVALVRLTLAGYSGKRWVTRRDSYVRPTHADVDGTTVDLYSSFQVGRDLLRYPGDPSGSLDETINCRCVMIGVS